MPQQGSNCFSNHGGVVQWQKVKNVFPRNGSGENSSSRQRGKAFSCLSVQNVSPIALRLSVTAQGCTQCCFLIESFNKWTLSSSSEPCCYILLEARRSFINVHWSRMCTAFIPCCIQMKRDVFNGQHFVRGEMSCCFQVCNSPVSLLNGSGGNLWWGGIYIFLRPCRQVPSLHRRAAINSFRNNRVNAASNAPAYVLHWLLSVSDCVS